MQLIPIEKIVFNRDSIQKAREAFLNFILRQFISYFHRLFIFNLHCQIVLRISGNVLHKTRPM